jgi:hypothetical protein
MKLVPKILAASLFAASPFWLAGSVHAESIGMGLGLKNAVTPAAEIVMHVGGGRGGAVRGGAAYRGGAARGGAAYRGGVAYRGGAVA